MSSAKTLLRTEQAYVGWIKRYIIFHGKRHPSEMGKLELEAFLTALAVKYPNATRALAWQYVFPAVGFSVDPRHPEGKSGGVVRRLDV